MSNVPRPIVLAVLDGFGECADSGHNAVTRAKTPVLDALKSQFPHALIHASEEHVGLPKGQMGNSEVGHMNIGAGRVVMQDIVRIDKAADEGGFARNPVLADLISALKLNGGVCHVMGLLSPGGVHAHQHHMAVLARLIHAQGIEVKIHAFLDGRDTPPKSALEYVAQFRREFPAAEFATVSGRYYAMDRDNRWERVEPAYRAMVEAQGARFESNEDAIEASYSAGKTDEFVLPAVIGDYKGMNDKDAVVMINFRADRARQILQALLDPAFAHFARKVRPHFTAVVGMVEYSETINQWMKPLFASESLTGILGEVLAKHNLKQLRIAETEKYAHVTFFFNGGREEPFDGESRILVPSPKVATYDLQPEMSAREVTDKLVGAITKNEFDFILVNYANTDMVGHTGSMEAAVAAVETVDKCLGQVWEALTRHNGALIVTADHGNAEQMFDEATGQPHTAHTLNLVPVIVAQASLAGKRIGKKDGTLADLAPTVLRLLGLEKPYQMTGEALV